MVRSEGKKIFGPFILEKNCNSQKAWRMRIKKHFFLLKILERK